MEDKETFQQTAEQPTQPQVSMQQDAQKKDKKGFAIASLVLGLVGLIAWFIPIIGIIVGVLGIVFGALSVKSSKRGFAIAGIILSILCIIGSVIYAIYSAYVVSQVLTDFYAGF